jgi:hypothetical protein
LTAIQEKIIQAIKQRSIPLKWYMQPEMQEILDHLEIESGRFYLNLGILVGEGKVKIGPIGSHQDLFFTA